MTEKAREERHFIEPHHAGAGALLTCSLLPCCPPACVLMPQLIMNVDCKDQAECGKAGVKLFNSSSQTRLTDALARNSVSLLPGTFQVCSHA